MADKWEYIVLTISKEDADQFEKDMVTVNSAGSMGWELVTVQDTNNTPFSRSFENWYAFMKRRVDGG